VELVFEEPAGTPALSTDAGRLAQILRKLSVERGEVLPNAGRSAFSVKAGPGDTLIFVVKDTGIGIRAGESGADL